MVGGWVNSRTTAQQYGSTQSIWTTAAHKADQSIRTAQHIITAPAPRTTAVSFFSAGPWRPAARCALPAASSYHMCCMSNRLLVWSPSRVNSAAVRSACSHSPAWNSALTARLLRYLQGRGGGGGQGEVSTHAAQEGDATSSCCSCTAGPTQRRLPSPTHRLRAAVSHTCRCIISRRKPAAVPQAWHHEAPHDTMAVHLDALEADCRVQQGATGHCHVPP